MKALVEASEQIEKFQEFFEASYKNALHEAVTRGEGALIVDFFELSKFDHDLAEQLLDEPEETIKAAEIAIEQIDLGKFLRVRFQSLPDAQKISIRNLRSFHLGQFICLEGTIRQASEVRPEVVMAKFECPSCGNTIKLAQTEQKFREPSRCSCGRKGFFRLLSKDLVDVQRLVIEESAHLLEGGAQPKRLAVFLREDLVDPKMTKWAIPGASVIVNGVLKEIPIPAKDKGISTRFDIVMNANFVEPTQQDFSEIEVTDEDAEAIRKLAKEKQIYQKMVQSIAPSIYGHDKIKEGIALQLFGAVAKVKKDNTRTRGDIHILLVGDPGAGKSQLLTFVKATAPKARYIAGRGATGSGMTAAVVKDEFLRGWALEAGALVLAHKGILAVDELDKISREDTAALHEGLEQQQISISKANIQATLQCQTSVLAAANPKFGRFDYFVPIAQQIDLPPALINRFDLIFVVKDLPDKDRDANIAHQVLMNQSYQDKGMEIPPELFRKYIAYAKTRIIPVLSEEAIETIKKFYVDLRNSNQNERGVKSIPISARQLEAIVRLAEASARIRLSEKILKSDVARAIDLVMYSLTEVGMDPETKRIDIDRIGSGMTASERGRVVSVRDIIFQMSEQGKQLIPVEEIVAEAVKKGIAEHKVEESLDKLKRSGDIFEPKRGFVQKI